MNCQTSANIVQSAQSGEISHVLSMSNSRIAEAADMAFLGGSGDIPENPLLDDCSRISLRKRKANCGMPLMVSCNSAFLSGIFADIAQANASSCPSGGQVSFSNECADFIDGSAEDTDIATHTHKKSRISLTKSLSRNAKSYRSLAEISAKIEDQPPSTPCEEDPVNILSFTDTTFPTGKLTTAFPKHNSLEFQLSCVSKESGAGLISPKKPLTDEDFSDVLAFPHLPATVSSSSCSSNNLTRDTSAGQQAFASETSSYNVVKGDDKESYGWFIETDADDATTFVNPLETVRNSETSQLAFKAPTAPKQVDYDAEVEWAKAADTVDDVLSDFF
uniref:Uncharacterized protein n=1 Tax=Ditylum brightwellii TaxID=49249 RepID=A0A7S1YRH9_9STRA|mmetsp:Transcript_14724/g.21938  ORF Transcript_14724/g.21938 Transcript_14724/m.21938 type:complete len:333 (+) Transcript_14724:135-1133(+)